MVYVKVDGAGNIIEFPYRIDERFGIPTDAVKVDTQELKPNVKWDKKLIYDSVQRTNDGRYLLSYKIEDKFDNLEQKRGIIITMKSQYCRQNLSMFESKVGELKSGYSNDEILSWDIQVEESNRFFDGKEDKNTLIDAISNSRGISKSELASRILQKRDVFLKKYGEILGKFQRNSDVLDSIDLDDQSTYDYIDDYGW